MASVELIARVTPRADADRVGPYAAGVLQVRVTRPPANGEANRAVLRLIARALGVPVSRLTIVAGTRSRTKRYAVAGLSATDLSVRLAVFGD